jgi:hypothetical protein
MPDVDVKGDNFGAGLPKDIFDEIIGLVTGSASPGGDADKKAVLEHLAREEHAALRPGKGVTGLLQASLKFAALESAVRALEAATSDGEANDAIAKLVAALQAIGLLWTAGPVPDAFFGSE